MFNCHLEQSTILVWNNPQGSTHATGRSKRVIFFFSLSFLAIKQSLLVIRPLFLLSPLVISRDSTGLTQFQMLGLIKVPTIRLYSFENCVCQLVLELPTCPKEGISSTVMCQRQWTMTIFRWQQPHCNLETILIKAVHNSTMTVHSDTTNSSSVVSLIQRSAQ